MGTLEHLPGAYVPNPAPRYRVRLLKLPCVLYNGRSYEYAKRIMERTTHDCALEMWVRDGWDAWWKTVVSVENRRVDNE